MFQTANLRIFFGLHADVNKKNYHLNSTIQQLNISTKNSIFAVKFEKTMKSSLVLFLLFVLSLLTVQGQEYPTNDTRDYRAPLIIFGRINEISVAPDEQIWLTTAAGEIYYTNSIDSNWHYGSPLTSWHYGQPVPSPRRNWSDIPWEDMPYIDRISFFNADTAIMTGSIPSSEGPQKLKSGYYRTTDGGHTWKLRDIGGDGWIYAAITSGYGFAWLGTADKTIYYSTDFGEHFKALKIPLKNSDRIYGLYMADAFHGIIGSDENEILITENNWRTARSIPTPLDQKKVVASELDNRPRINKVLMWGSYLIAEQCGKAFYTTTGKKVNWQAFPVRIYDFTLDKNTNLLWAVDDSLRVLTFTSPTEYVTPTDKRIPTYPIDIKAVNNSLYMILSNKRVCRANHKGLICHFPYTSDQAIEDPCLMESGDHLIWGVEEKQLYIADKKERRWYREAELDFPTCGIKLLSDSVAILWDGLRNHRYSLPDHTIENYTLSEPLRDFLAVPIKKFSISSGSQGCFHYFNHQIEYNVTQDTLLKKALMSKEEGFKDRTDTMIDITVNVAQLVRLLKNVDTNPEKKPEIQDFNITKIDKTHYMGRVQKRLDLGKYDFSKIEKKDKSLYSSIPDMLDDIDKATLCDILNMGEGFTSTTKSWFKIEFVNQNNDTCWMRNFYYEDGDPWFLPWRFEYKGQHFNCYDVALSRFIKNCITEDFYGREAFDNAVLLMKIGDYYCRKRR